MTILEKIQLDLVQAMKAKATVKLRVLRAIKSSLMNKKVEIGRTLSDEDAYKVLFTLVKQRKDSIDQFGQGGRQDLVDQETAELRILETYVPAAVSESDIEAVVTRAIRDLQASSINDLGKVMKLAMAEFSGRNVDGKIVSATVKRRLEAE